MKKFALRAGGVLVALIALLVFWGATKQMSRMQASGDWTKAAGRITANELQDFSVGRKEKYKAHIEYSYNAAGQQRTGTRIRFADATGSSRAAQQAFLDKYPAGAAVDVYYDPADPAQSVLEPGGGARRFGLLIAPSLIATLAIAILVAGFKR